MPAMAFKRVVFPQPEGPTMAMKCPPWTLKEISLRSRSGSFSLVSISSVMSCASSIMYLRNNKRASLLVVVN